MSVSNIMGVPVANIAKINGIPIANISKWNGEDIVTDVGSDFITEWVVPSSSLSVALPLSNGLGIASFNCTVDWGDGSQISTITSYNDADRIHTYANAGTYQIKIRGVCEGWDFTTSSDKLKITKVINFGYGSRFAGFTYLNHGFDGCQNLVSLGTQPIKASSSGLLTSVTACFQNCVNLTTLPNGLFRDKSSIYIFNACFFNCVKLQVYADIFYFNGEQSTRFINKSANFSECFYRTTFTGVQGTAPDLWNCDFGTGTPNKTSCFGGVGNNTTSISNYASIPADWK